jgi:(S)-2-hydroxy-acid oxidase
MRYLHLPEMSTKTLQVTQQQKRQHPNSKPTIPPSLRQQHQSKIRKIDVRQECFNVNDFQLLAKKYLPKDLYEYIASGTDDAQTLLENRVAFQRWFLRPRVMKSVGNISTRTQLFSYTVNMPVFVSPAGVHALCHEEGECATARACAKAGIMFALSQHSTKSIEEVRRTNKDGIQFYQAYILKDRNKTIRLIRRAIHAGYHGIIVTVDSVRFGYREADARNGFNALPPPHRLVNYDDDHHHDHHYHHNDDNNHSSSKNDDPNDSNTTRCYNYVPNNNNYYYNNYNKLDISPSNTSTATGTTPTTNLDQTYNSQQKKAWDQNSEQMLEQNVTWNDLTWIKSILPTQPQHMPLIIKGIMTAEDALLAMEAGADGIMVSNHGGRQLDGCLATIDVLPEIVHVVQGRVPIWLDGGVRRGTDILKALCKFFFSIKKKPSSSRISFFLWLEKKNFHVLT